MFNGNVYHAHKKTPVKNLSNDYLSIGFDTVTICKCLGSRLHSVTAVEGETKSSQPSQVYTLVIPDKWYQQ